MDIEERADTLTPRPGFRLVRAVDLTFTPPRFLIRDYLEEDSLALIFGDPGCGKSFIGIDVACCIATGHAFHGHKVTPGPVVYVAGEGHNGIKRRLNAWEIRNGQSLNDAPLFVSTGPAALCDAESAQTVIKAVDEAAQQAKPAVVVLDTVARNFGPGDENSTRDMGQFIAAADMLRTRYGCTVLLIHHAGHADKTRARGAMALKGALDAEYRMDKDESGVIRFEATKMKDAETPPPLAFKLQTVELGVTDDEGQPVTSAILEPTGYEAPKAKTKRRGKNQQMAIDALREQMQRFRESKEAAGGDPDTARVPMPDWRDACFQKGMARQRFYDTKHALERDEEIVITQGFVSLAG